MIIVLAPDDTDIINVAKNQSAANAAIYGICYVWGNGEIPQLRTNEDLFLIGHGNTADEIGNRDGDMFFNGIDLVRNIKPIFPTRYNANIYIDACYTANIPRGGFSLIENVKNQINVLPGIGSVYIFGRRGSVTGAIPAPRNNAWIRA
jgi:hypothetical protein